MPSQEKRASHPFSEEERLFQGPPYIYTSGTVPVKERDAEYVFYQTWTDARVAQRNADVPQLDRVARRLMVACMDAWTKRLWWTECTLFRDVVECRCGAQIVEISS
jgi:hypothetical protein